MAGHKPFVQGVCDTMGLDVLLEMNVLKLDPTAHVYMRGSWWRNSFFKIQDTRYKIQDTRYKINRSVKHHYLL
jgi:hypothetical protein